MAGPRVSVLMPVYNGAAFLRPAVESILSQDFGDFELLVVDDGSTDDTPRVLAEWKDERMRVLRNERNERLVASLNRAIGEARGEYLARMDADDVSRPGRLGKQVRFLDDHPEVGVVGTCFEEIDEAGRVVEFHDLQCDDAELQEALLRRNRICHGSVMMRREVVRACGGYSDAFRGGAEDYDLWLRVCEKFRVANLREYLYVSRSHPRRVTVREADEQREGTARAQATAWRRRAWSARLWDPRRTLAWARAAARDGRPLAATVLMAKAVAAGPLRAETWRMALRAAAWWGRALLGLGWAAALRNEKLIRREFAARRTVLRSHPSMISLLMNDACNSMCVMCGGDYFSHRSGRKLTVEKVRRIFDHLRPRLLTSIHFGGAGEPLLNPEFPEIAALVRRRCPHAELLLITNGIALDDRAVRTLIDRRIHALVSVNAATAETYRRVAQVDRFDEVRRNVAALVEARDRAGACLCDARRQAPVQVTLSFVATRRNIEELPEFVRMASALGADRVKMLYCRMYPESFRTKSCGPVENRLRTEESLFFHQELSDRCVVEAYRVAARMGIDLEHVPLFAGPAPGGECDFPWRVLYIGFDGEVYWCPGGETLFQSAVESGRYKSGNLLTQDIREIWNNEFFRRLRTTLLTGSSFPSECAACGNHIEWDGVRERGSHVMEWRGVQPGGAPMP